MTEIQSRYEKITFWIKSWATLLQKRKSWISDWKEYNRRVLKVQSREAGYILAELLRSETELYFYELRHMRLKDFAFAPGSYCPVFGESHPLVWKGQCTYYGSDESKCAAVVWKEQSFVGTIDHRADIAKAIASGEVPPPEVLKKLAKGPMAFMLDDDRPFGEKKIRPIYLLMYTVKVYLLDFLAANYYNCREDVL